MSDGRAEVILGRGSFTESFPLFGYSLDDYDVLFEEKLALFAALRDADRTGEPVRWKGTVRPPLDGVRVFPPVERPPLRTWVGVGGSPESVVRAARYGFPLTLAIIGGDPRRFAAYVELYHRALAQLGSPHAAGRRPLAGAHRGHRRRRRARSSGRRTRSCATGSAPSAGGARRAGPSSTARSPRARSTSARPRRSRARSPRRCARSARPASISSTAPARSRHERLLRSIELYGREVIPRVRRAARRDPAGAGRGDDRRVGRVAGGERHGPAVRARSRADRRRRRRRAGVPPLARSRAPRRAVGLPPLLARRAPRHAGHRERRDGRRHRPRRRRHRHHPGRRRRHHAAEPRAARDRRAVRHPRLALPRADRPRARPRAGLGPAHRPGAAPEPAGRRDLSRRRRRADGVFPAARIPARSCGPCPAPGSTCRSGSSARASSARSSRPSSGCRTPSPRTSRRPRCPRRSSCIAPASSRPRGSSGRT